MGVRGLCKRKEERQRERERMRERESETKLVSKCPRLLEASARIGHENNGECGNCTAVVRTTIEPVGRK